jgi:protocatechuate 3,4-dioxygenase beta subunit
MALDRRLFLATSLGAALGRPVVAARQHGLDAFGGDTLPCTLDVKATPAVSPDDTYRPGAPLRTSVIESAQHGIPLRVTGLVAGLSCGPIAGAALEFWQADAAGVFDTRGVRFRSRQVTGAGGRYTLATVVPGASGGRAPSINVRVVVEKKAELWTAMFFPGQRANARDPRFKDELLVTLGGTDANRTAAFDIRLNL